jgi:hypothetical protein
VLFAVLLLLSLRRLGSPDRDSSAV